MPPPPIVRASRLRDEQADEQKFYQTRAERIVFTELMTPKDAPEWARDRNALWNHAERAEKRKDAQLAREFEMSLPHELTEQQREWLVKDFAREAFVRKGYAVDIAIHAPDKDSDERNHHAHLMVTMRTLGADGFAAEKDRELNSRAQLGAWREQWAHLANRHLERHGHEARIDHRSLKEQGIDREAGVHLGYAANEMAQRGAQSDRMDRLKGVIERNDIRLDMAALDREAAELGRQSLEKARAFASDMEALERMAALQKLEKAVKADARRLAEPRPGAVSPEREFGEGIRAAARIERRDEKGRAEQLAWKNRMEEQKPGVVTPEAAKAAVVKPVEKGLQVADRATGMVTGLADYLSNIVSGHSEKPAPEHDKGGVGGIIHDDPKLRKEQQMARYAAVKAEREADKALERIEDDMKQGRSLSSSDIQNSDAGASNDVAAFRRRRHAPADRRFAQAQRARLRRTRAGLIEGSRVIRRDGSRSDEAAGTRLRPFRGDAGRNRIEERAAAVASFRATARSLTRSETPAPKPRKRVKTGGDGKGYAKGGARFAARGLVQDYLELCRNPLKDLRRWAAEDKRFGRAPRGFQAFITKGGDHADNQGAAVALAKAAGLRGQPLPGLRLRVDAHGSRGRADGVSARPGAGSGGDDGLRSLRAERGGFERGGLVSVFALALRRTRRAAAAMRVPTARRRTPSTPSSGRSLTACAAACRAGKSPPPCGR